MGSVVQIRGPVNARPQLRYHLRRDKIVVGRGKFVFGAGRRKWAWRRSVGRSLAERDGRGSEHDRKQSYCELCVLHRVLQWELVISMWVISGFEAEYHKRCFQVERTLGFLK